MSDELDKWVSLPIPPPTDIDLPREYTCELLMNAINTGDLESVHELVSDVSIQDLSDAFFLAVELDELHIVEALVGLVDNDTIIRALFLSANNDTRELLVMYIDTNSIHMYDVMCHPRYKELITYLKERGHVMDSQEALCLYSKKGDRDKVNFLIQEGVDIHANHERALRWAAEEGHVDLVKEFMTLGADIHALGDEVLRVAAENGHIEVVQYVVETYAYTMDSLNEAVIRATEHGHVAVVAFLYDHGVNLNARYQEALRMASDGGYIDVVDYLVRHGAIIKRGDDIVGEDYYTVKLRPQ